MTTLRVEDYALIGDTHTAALVGRNGSVDWLCLPRFDSPACFASLLGADEHGSWIVAPSEGIIGTSRSYRPGTLVLETEFQVEDGESVLAAALLLLPMITNLDHITTGPH